MKTDSDTNRIISDLAEKYPEKFIAEEDIFKKIKRGARIFIGTACGEPQYLVNALINFVESNPRALLDAELYQVWTLGLAPYTSEKYRRNFRSNSFFIGTNMRASINRGAADYSPVFLSQVPQLFHRKIVPIDVAMIQTAPPDEHGYVSLGISVDITKAAVENAHIVIAQINSQMPKVHGDSFIHVSDIDFFIHKNETILEFETSVKGEIAERIGTNVAKIINNGDTLQVGYGNLPNAVLPHLKDKKNLGVHTELLTEGIVELMKLGVVNNSQKTILRGKTAASFCMGARKTYDFLHDNPGIEFRPIDYINNPLVIARNRNMTAINSALQIDLTGQATAESLGTSFYSGVGGSADFMRGAVLAPGGKTLLLLQSTAKDEEVSRIVPMLDQGAGVTLIRGDIQYVVTEYGIAYLYGKNIRERAMDLIAISHPKFRPWLIEQAKELNLIFKDQAFIPGEAGKYPESLETFRTTSKGLKILLRPVKISDEPALKEFFYSLSDDTIYKRFVSPRKDLPHETLQRFVAIDFTKQMVILAVVEIEGVEEIVGVGQYFVYEKTHIADVALVVSDAFQFKGIGSELMNYLAHLAVKQGLLGFTCEVLVENSVMLHVLEKMNFDIKKRFEQSSYEVEIKFRKDSSAMKNAAT